MAIDFSNLTPADGMGDPIGGSDKNSQALAKLDGPNQDPQAISEVNQFYERTRRERRPYEVQWFVNAAMVRGVQTARWSSEFNRLTLPNAPKHRVKKSINLILPKVKARLSKSVKNRPKPVVIAASTDQEKVMDAKITEKALDYQWRKQLLETKYEDAVWWSYITGKSFWWFHWNPQALGRVKAPDNPLTNQPGEIVEAQLGDLMVELGTAVEFLPGDLGISRLADQQQIMRVKVREVADVEARYQLPPETLKPETSSGDLFQFAKQIASLGSRSVGYTGDDGNEKDGKPSKIVVKELFDRPSATYPQGRYRVVAGSTLLRDEQELPYQFGDSANPFPAVEFADTILPGQFWPSTMIENLINIQKEYNDYRSQINEQIRMQAHPKLMAAKQMGLSPNAYNSEAGEKIEYHGIPGIQPPYFLAPPSIAADVWRVLQVVKLEFDDISSIHPADVGNQSNAGESGFQTNLLQEASEAVHGPDIRRNELAIEEASFKIRRLMKLGYDVPRLLTIAGKNNLPDVFEFSADNIDENADVIVQAGSALPTLKAARAKMIMDMHQAMLFGNPQDPSVQRKVLGMLDVGGTEQAVDMIRRDEDQARQENLAVSKGQPIADPMPWENHQIHTDIHADQLKSPDIQMWQQPQRDELVKHWILHASFINPQYALGLAQQFGFQDVIAIVQPKVPPPPPPQMPPQGPQGPTPEDHASQEHIAAINAHAGVQKEHIKGAHQTLQKQMELAHQPPPPQQPM